MDEQQQSANPLSSGRGIAAVLDEIGDVFCLFTPDDELRYWNDTLADVTGYSEQEIESMDPASLFAPHVRMHIKDDIARALEDERVRMRAPLQTKDGERVPYDFSAGSFTIDGETVVLGVGRELDEDEPRTSQDKLHEYVFDSHLAGIAIADLAGEVLAVNPAFLDMWGYENESDVVGKSVVEFWKRPEKASEVADTITQDGEWDGRLVALRQDGTTFHARASASLVTDETGDPVSVTSSFIDVTERVERERELERQTEQLEEFASVISHDIRNPLNIATGYLQLAREEGDSEHLDRAAAALERIESIIEDTLVLAKQGQSVSERDWIHVRQIAEQCWGMVETGDVRLTVTEPFEIYADQSRLRHVFENLFRNTVEHGGRARTVRVGPIETFGFYVEDDGDGLPEGDREHVLEPGYTTDDEGTGFGLTIVNRIAQAHGWDLEIASSPDGGARFEFVNVAVQRPPETSESTEQ